MQLWYWFLAAGFFVRFGGSGASGRFEGSGRYEGSEDLETFNRPRRHSKSDALDYSVMVHVLVRVDKKCIGLPQKGALEKPEPDSWRKLFRK